MFIEAIQTGLYHSAFLLDSSAFKPVVKFIDFLAKLVPVAIAAYTAWIYAQIREINRSEEQATKKARESSIQTLDVAPADSIQHILVEVTNSGGGAAKDICGIVDFEAASDLDIEAEIFERKVRRRSSIRHDDENGPWIASEGNAIAAEEREVRIELQCSTILQSDTTAYAFPTAVRKFAEAWNREVCRILVRDLGEETLVELAEKWEEPIIRKLATRDVADVDTTKLETEQLYTIIKSVSSRKDISISDDAVPKRDIRMTVELEYTDDLLENVGEPTTLFGVVVPKFMRYFSDDTNEPATRKESILDVTFPATDDIKLQDIFDEECRTDKPEYSPR